MRKVIGWFFSLLFDIAAVLIIFFVIKSFAIWYLSQTPAVGVDLFNSITYVSYHLRHFSLPWTGFKYTTFAGFPLMRDFPQLAFYSMLPAAKFLGAGLGVQVTALLGLFLFLYFSYLLFSRLARNTGIGLLLTAFVYLSVNIYGALTWAGSIPSFISQMFLPLVLFTGLKYLEEPKLKYVAGMALFSAIGILFHPLEIVAFVVPAALILIVSGNIINRTGIGKLFRHVVIYGLGFFFGAFTFTYDIFIGLITRGILPGFLGAPDAGISKQVDPGGVAIANFYKDQVKLLITQTHPGLFYLLPAGCVLFVLGLIIAKKRRAFLYTIPFLFIAAYMILQPVVNFYGIVNFFHHDPYRAFWPFPVAIAALVASLSGLFFRGLSERSQSIKWLAKLSVVPLFSFAVSVILFGATIFIIQSDTASFLRSVSEKIEYSSAFPEALSLSFKKEETEKLSHQLVPSFMDPSDKNKRLYTSDATVNIWWNSFFDLPLMRGYIDPPVGTTLRGGLFWLDIAIANDTIVRDFKISQEQAYQNSLFLIDWNAIHFFEGGRMGSKGPSVPPSSYLINNGVFEDPEELTTYGAVLKWQTESGKPELHMDLPQILKFYKVKEKYSSPVISATNAAAVLVVADFPGYEDILRLLGARNLNSKKIIPVFGDKYLDAFSEEQLKKFSAVILHQYTYKNRNKAFQRLAAYVNSGGKVFIDTGSEIADAESTSLPEPLPITGSSRKGRGREWRLEAKHELLSGIDTSEFAPLIFNDQQWKLTMPDSSEKLREGSETYLSQDGIPIVVGRTVGSGKIIWSGMNLPYHFNQYNKDVEAILFETLLGSLISLKETEPIPATVDWVRPENVRITPTAAAKGILFKEEGYSGWGAHKGTGLGGSLPIYLAGPTFPGFMYIPLSDTKPSVIEFRYNGDTRNWIALFVTCVVLFLLADLFFTQGKVLIPFLNVFGRRVGKHMGGWWNREEEE